MAETQKKYAANDIETAIEGLSYLNPSREISLAKTKLEEALMWIEKDENND